MSGKPKNLIGIKFGRLEVIKDSGIRQYRSVIWTCICDCGKFHNVNSQSLIKGWTRSCGCLQKEIQSNRLKKDYGEASFNRLYRSYKRGALYREMNFQLSKEELKSLTSGNCFYCGESPSQIEISDKKYLNGVYIYNGIDRLDNSKGYIMDNCVPCCWKCNRAKNNLSVEEFISWIKKSYKYLKERKLINHE